jgi:predicted nucleotide-binding protein
VSNVLNAVFGDPNDVARTFERASRVFYRSDYTESDCQAKWLRQQRTSLIVLEVAAAELSDLDGPHPDSGATRRIAERIAVVSKAAEKRSRERGSAAFLVHGRDDGAGRSVAQFLDEIALDVIVMHEETEGGLRIVEKFERYANVPFAVIVVTGDDLGRPKDAPEEDAKPRAIQDVIIEMGYFVGKLGRSNVFVLLEDGIEAPSNYLGVRPIPFSSGGSWRASLARELTNAGARIDLRALGVR